MSKVENYRQQLRLLQSWEPFLLQESNLPGPRANLELVQAAADEGDEGLFRRLMSFGPDVAPTGTADEFLPVCGVVGLGRLLAEGRTEFLEVLRHSASDPRWRVREGVAMALQRLGDKDMGRLLAAMDDWREGSPLEQRAAAAALCEPRLLTRREHVARVLGLLDQITASLCAASERSGEDWRVLRQGLGYCWSVAVVACPDIGKPLLEKWLASRDHDIRWIMRENLKKNRLVKLDAPWVERMRQELSTP